VTDVKILKNHVRDAGLFRAKSTGRNLLVQIFAQCMIAALIKKGLNTAATAQSSLVKFIMLLKTPPPPTKSIAIA